ncbi:MAG: dienelactone hydrolase family protein [Ancalomicrobiaceae bacterium]|nr:dienelactone hydrolase family protein [Ancalomicrobiaceae bacterium]
MSRSLVILLHGVGAGGADMLSLAEGWRSALAETEFTAPDAPFAFDQGPTGRQWFSVAGVHTHNRSGRVVAAREAFDRTLRAVIEAAGFADRLGRVVLVGFSQGSIMALDAVASGRWPVAGIVAFSGRLSTPEPLTPAPNARILLIHGGADGVIPASESAHAEERLAHAGLSVSRQELPGLGHWISPDGAALAGQFLAGLIGQA